MPPRSSTDREDNSLRDTSWASCSYETSTNKQAPAVVEPLVLSKRTVTFAATAKVRQVTKLTKDQAKDVWFAGEDFQRMKKSFAPTVQRMVAGDLTPEEEELEVHCTRGLEYRTKDGARRRMKNKYDGMAAVLHEQDRQVFEDNRDPEQLAKVYMDINCKCSFESLALGRRDEADIREYMSTNTEPKYDSSSGSEDTTTVTAANTNASAVMAARRLGKLRGLKHSGSFHERSIRGLKRMLSGSKILRRNNSSAAAATVAVV